MAGHTLHPCSIEVSLSLKFDFAYGGKSAVSGAGVNIFSDFCKVNGLLERVRQTTTGTVSVDYVLIRSSSRSAFKKTSAS